MKWDGGGEGPANHLFLVPCQPESRLSSRIPQDVNNCPEVGLNA